MCELTTLDEFLGYWRLGANKQKHVVGEAEDLVSFGLIQAHSAGVCPVQQVHHPAGDTAHRQTTLSTVSQIYRWAHV